MDHSIELNWLPITEHLEIQDLVELSSVCKKWRDLFFDNVTIFVQRQMEDFSAGPPQYYADTFYKCLAKHCEFNGTVQNKGFCSVCARKPDNMASDEALTNWVAMCKAVDDRSTRKHNADVAKWNASKAKHDEQLKNMKQFLVQIKNLKSFKSPYHMDFEDTKENYPLLVDTPFLASHFSHSLQCLNIPYARLDDAAVEAIATTLPNLIHLNIKQAHFFYSENGITSSGYAKLNALTKLEHLDISIDTDYESVNDSTMTGEVLNSLTGLSKLKVLVALQCEFRENKHPFAFVSNFPLLEVLSVSYSTGIECSKQVFDPLKSLPNLYVLDIRSTQIDEESLYTVTSLPLEYLFLQNIDHLAKKFIQQHIITMKCLKGVGLGWCGEHDSSVVEKIFSDANDQRKQPIELFGSGACTTSSGDWSVCFTPCVHCVQYLDTITY